MKYDVSGTFLSRPFTVRGVEAINIHEAKKKVRNLIKFEGGVEKPDEFLKNFFGFP